MTGHAVLVEEPEAAPAQGAAAKLLRFFGIAPATIGREALVEGRWTHSQRIHLLCSADTFAALIAAGERHATAIGALRERIVSVFVYAGRDREALQATLRCLAGGDGRVVDADRRDGHWTVTDGAPDVCGVMSGVRCADLAGQVHQGFQLPAGTGRVSSLITRGDTATLIRGSWNGIPTFLSAEPAIVDLDAPIQSRNFDVRTQFMTAVPLVLYVRWAFAQAAWRTPDHRACVVIDDPLLTPQYGCVNFQRLLDLMQRHDFATSIAFIPRNRRRSSPKVVRLFTEHPDRYSLSIHGCDHTGGEFGTRDEAQLGWRAAQAIARMDEHAARTGIRHDDVMVFPQGVFSDAAMGALKRAGYLAAVNTELLSVDGGLPAPSIGEAWDVALMRYQTFPIFTRRYPSQGIENYAFDLLVGKPSIVVIHHDFCADRYEELVACVDRLNALNCRLSWCNLGQIVRGGYREKEAADGSLAVEIFGSAATVRNPSPQRRRLTVTRRESEPAAIVRIVAGSDEMQWVREGASVRFDIDLEPGESRDVRLEFQARAVPAFSQPVRARVKAFVRRRLSEVRDNYVVRPYLTASDRFQRSRRAAPSDGARALPRSN